MSNTIRPIETYYKGYRFRSRLEARWAVFFDALNIKWDYEVEGYELPGGIHYLPDFLLPAQDCTDAPILFEVKPDPSIDDDTIQKIAAYAYALGDPAIPDSLIVALGSPRHTTELLSITPQLLGRVHLGMCPCCFDDPTAYHFFAIATQNNGAFDEWGWSELQRRTVQHPRMIAAYTAARSARFEFGEKG